MGFGGMRDRPVSLCSCMVVASPLCFYAGKQAVPIAGVLSALLPVHSTGNQCPGEAAWLLFEGEGGFVTPGMCIGQAAFSREEAGAQSPFPWVQ